ncbi:MAG TPA: bifunctional DNA-formamidopyrimidine glycosylase/DNA-(apurinic or apyrimidinic site) lyase [Symbiobacteriaceae bacterium]|nr:bifunctional DNA-formamidopyrimidine glycosylase/DNA-(apurinic or apyrimidinic site) lyase [Symbiobacteriaceae bacterium]
MPELPEVETVRRTLYDKLVGQSIERVEIKTPRQVYHPDPDTFKAELEGARFSDIDRRGKYLLFRLGPLTLVAHLRMSGHLYVCEPDRVVDKHTHVIFYLENGTQLRYDDQRKFGGFHLLGPKGEGMPPGLAAMGPEPLSDEFTPEVLAKALAGRRSPVKAALLNQSLVAGLGNIYVDESLFCAGVHPERLAETLSADEVQRLHGCIVSVLTRAVAKRGTTFSLYFDGEGQQGDMYDELQVFDRAGEPCPRCGTPIVKLAVAQRGTHVCPQCQPAPEGARLAPRRARPGRRGESVTVAAEPPKPYNAKDKRKSKGD